jgi:hypothetical protein
MNAEQRAMMRDLTRKFMAVSGGKVVEGGWNGFRDTSIKPDAPDVQLRDMKASFFAGATYAYLTLVAVIDEAMPLDESTAVVAAIDAELVEHSRALGALMAAGLKTDGNA